MFIYQIPPCKNSLIALHILHYLEGKLKPMCNSNVLIYYVIPIFYFLLTRVTYSCF